eukprot:GHUV01034958.1.p1 GENE.GHUV01034958.1~~GHUV01034958.1.p1  ORF type:complete len:237 (+),score=106.59 GHUV01034958.1:293-1003(+)
MAKKKKDKQQLPEPLETQRNYVLCGPVVNTHTQTQTSASQYMPVGVDNSWDFDAWSGDFEIKVQSLSPDRVVFDMIGVDPAVANALRRILISEVPTVAIEHVFIVNNTSIIQVLARQPRAATNGCSLLGDSRHSQGAQQRAVGELSVLAGASAPSSSSSSMQHITVMMQPSSVVPKNVQWYQQQQEATEGSSSKLQAALRISSSSMEGLHVAAGTWLCQDMAATAAAASSNCTASS